MELRAAGTLCEKFRKVGEETPYTEISKNEAESKAPIMGWFGKNHGCLLVKPKKGLGNGYDVQ